MFTYRPLTSTTDLVYKKAGLGLNIGKQLDEQRVDASKDQTDIQFAVMDLVKVEEEDKKRHRRDESSSRNTEKKEEAIRVVEEATSRLKSTAREILFDPKTKKERARVLAALPKRARRHTAATNPSRAVVNVSRSDCKTCRGELLRVGECEDCREPVHYEPFDPLESHTGRDGGAKYKRVVHMREYLHSLCCRVRISLKTDACRCPSCTCEAECVCVCQCALQIIESELVIARVAVVDPKTGLLNVLHPHRVTYELMLRIFKDHCLTKYKKQIYAIIKKYAGDAYTPLSLTREEEDDFIRYLGMIEQTFQEIQPALVPKRRNCPSYPYCARQIAKLIGFSEERQRHFVLLKSEKCLGRQDQIFEMICKRRGWPFNTTVGSVYKGDTVFDKEGEEAVGEGEDGFVATKRKGEGK